LKTLGAKNAYINVIEEKHKERVNYTDIYKALQKHAKLYEDFATKHGYRLKFLGDYKYRIEPIHVIRRILRERLKERFRGKELRIKLRSIDIDLRKYLKGLEKNGDVRGYDLRQYIKKLQKKTSKNKGFNAYLLVNYSTKWAAKHKKKLKHLPNVNAIIRHTKGYVGGDMWIYNKFDKNTFVYAQNASSSVNWSDRQMVYLVASAFRSFLLNSGSHQSKVYKRGEDKLVKHLRESKLSMIHKNLHDNEKMFPKRVVIFSMFGPEIYEF
jgi:hypothetical protein